MQRKLIGVIVLCLGWRQLSVEAVETISNLMVPSTTGTIGPIHSLGPGQTFAGRFATGADPYTLNIVTLEHLVIGSFVAYPPEAKQFRLQLYKETGVRAFEHVANLGNPVLDPRSTIFPTATAFFSYTPAAAVVLDPNSTYVVAASTTPDGPGYETHLLFARTHDFTSSAGWQRLRDLSGNFDGGLVTGWRSSDYFEPLKFAVDATLVPEPSVLNFAIAGALVLIAMRLRKAD